MRRLPNGERGVNDDGPDYTADELAIRADAQLQNLRVALHDLYNAAGEITDPVTLAGVLADLRDHRQDVARVYDEIEQWVIHQAGDRRIEVPNLGVVEIKSSVRRTGWDHESLWRAVVARALDERRIDPETGELLESEAETLSRVLRECSTPSWRVGGLRDRGIDETEFCRVDEKHWTVKLPARKEAA